MGNTLSEEKEILEGDRDPLVSSLSRRKKRILGKEEIFGADELYKKMKSIPTYLPPHLDKCLEYHKTKPWLNKKVKYVLVAYPSTRTHPPQNIKTFFSSIPFTGFTQKEKQEIKNKGQNYIWYIPSKLLWQSHCYVQHQKDSQVICSSENLIRTFTDKGGKSQSFIFSVVYDDDTFQILKEEDYKKECEWWNRQAKVGGAFGERKMLLKNKSINTPEGEKARTLMKEKIAKIFTKLSGKPSYKDSDVVKVFENEFMKYIKSQNKGTIYDYVYSIIRILVFADTEASISNYTTSFRNRLTEGYYNVDKLPRLSIYDMFPSFYAFASKKK